MNSFFRCNKIGWAIDEEESSRGLKTWFFCCVEI
jgi:hypothetical protein